MKTDTALLIFDPHQDMDWIRRILNKEAGQFTHLLLGGDYFDAKSDRASSLGETCAFLHDLNREHGERLTLLWGNHDIQYLEAIPALRQFHNPRRQNYKIPGDYSNSRARKLSKLLDDSLIEKGHLFAAVNGYLISHSGVARRFWPEASDTEHAVARLNEICEDALLKLPYHDIEILQAGKARGGHQAIGGITWQDFDDEFSDDLELPQICGHTSDAAEDIMARARRKGRSWCLDGRQTIYGLLNHSGELDIRFA